MVSEVKIFQTDATVNSDCHFKLKKKHLSNTLIYYFYEFMLFKSHSPFYIPHFFSITHWWNSNQKKLGFSVLPRGTLTWGLEDPGIGPLTVWWTTCSTSDTQPSTAGGRKTSSHDGKNVSIYTKLTEISFWSMCGSNQLKWGQRACMAAGGMATCHFINMGRAQRFLR